MDRKVKSFKNIVFLSGPHLFL